MVGYWSNNSFCLVSSDKYIIQDFWKFFNNLDIAILTGNYKDNGGSGLTLVSISKMSDKVKQDMYAKDENAYKLGAAMNATGIEEKLRKANKYYMSLRPVWANEEKTEIKFHLNPLDQNIDNYGWFTLEDLIGWTEGIGPILKTRIKI